MLSEKESGALIAMLLGEKYLLDEELKNLYQENGISHILAISGLHISLIGMFVFKLLRKLKVPLIPATIFAILFIYSYGILTNFSVSTNRSVVMMMILLLSTILGKTYDMLSATALSAFIILLHNPLQIFSAGFLLSFGAVLGIAVLIPCLKELFPAKPAIVNSIYLSISAQIITMPMVLTFFFQFPVYSLLINLLILPCTSALVLSAIFAGIAGIICLPLGVFCIGGTNYILKFHEWVCRIGSNLPGNLITPGKPDALQLFLYTAFLLAFLWGVKRYKRRFLTLLPLMSVIVLLLPGDNPGLEITMIDVGQGDAIFLESASGTNYLIDGGSSDVSRVGTYRIQPFLLSQGVDHIDYAFVTHGDTDHISGLRELLAGNKIMIRRLVLPDTDYEDEALEELKSLAGERGVEILVMKRGDHLKEGDLLMTCLHPSPEYPATSKNAYSLVLSVTYGEFDMLFTGDLEKEGEELVTQLLQEQMIMFMNSDHSNVSGGKHANELLQPATDYDVLKVAHHGSKNSTFEEFLHIIKPEYALISCGKDNSYGHPNVELLERLSQVESKVMITYENGAICIKTDGERMEIEGYGE
jgi:competence protein ComEC